MAKEEENKSRSKALDTDNVAGANPADSSSESGIDTGAETGTCEIIIASAPAGKGKTRTVRPNKDSVCDDLRIQMVYRIIFCCVSALGCLLSIHFFTTESDMDYFRISDNFWQMYTDLSNYYIFIIGVIVTAYTVKRVFRGETRGNNEVVQTLKFCGVIMILVTFLVYNILLGDVTSPAFWNNIGNLCYHVAAPILFIVDWFIFDKHKTVKILDPVKTVIMPLIYVVYILIYGAICRAYDFAFEYPYFFLNVDDLGYGGVCLWVLALLVVFAALGYLFFVYDKLVKRDGHWKLDFKDLKLW